VATGRRLGVAAGFLAAGALSVGALVVPGAAAWSAFGAGSATGFDGGVSAWFWREPGWGCGNACAGSRTPETPQRARAASVDHFEA